MREKHDPLAWTYPARAESLGKPLMQPEAECYCIIHAQHLALGTSVDSYIKGHPGIIRELPSKTPRNMGARLQMLCGNLWVQQVATSLRIKRGNYSIDDLSSDADVLVLDHTKKDDRSEEGYEFLMCVVAAAVVVVPTALWPAAHPCLPSLAGASTRALDRSTVSRATTS